MKRAMAKSKGIARTGRRTQGTGKPMKIHAASSVLKRKGGVSLEQYTHTFP